MSIIELSALTRTECGKGPARQMRREGRVPAVIYGTDLEPLSISLDAVEFKGFLEAHNYVTSLIKLKFEGNDTLDSKVFMIKELQFHHIERKPMAVDFKTIDLDKPVVATVAIKFEGTAEGTKTGALLQPLSRTILVSCLPTEIPSSIPCDVTELGESQTWYAERLVLPEGATLKSPTDTPIVTCAMLRKEEEEVVDEAAEEGETPAGTEAAGDAADKKEPEGDKKKPESDKK
jgi:large subunit ribosomal protein L25